MSEYAVETKDLVKVYAGKEVLNKCSIHVKENSVYSLVGQNGAGKTTLFKALLGLVRATSGDAMILGLTCGTRNTELLRRTGNVIETPLFYEHLSARENLNVHIEYMKMFPDAREIMSIDEALETVGLSEASNQPIEEYSLGMRQRAAIARALVHRPEVLILDEPTNGLDPIGIVEMRKLFIRLKDRGMTILLSSHILSEVQRVSDRIGVIVKGRIICEKDIDEIDRQYPDGIEGLITEIAGGVENA